MDDPAGGKERVLFCYAHGRDEEWEGLCLDFDLAVQGRSFEEVRKGLETSIADYIASAKEETDEVRDRLLARRVPRLVQLKYVWRLIRAVIRGRDVAGESRASITIPCHA
jgi:hypothetical protein